MPNVKCGYPAKAVAAYLDGQIEVKEGSRGSSAYFINDRRVPAEHLRRIRHWETDVQLAGLAVVDRMLIYYDLAVWEYEHWATEKYGSDTFYDHDEVVKALTA